MITPYFRMFRLVTFSQVCASCIQILRFFCHEIIQFLLCSLVSLVVLTGSCESLSGLISSSSIPKEGTCDISPFFVLLFNMIMACFWIAMVRFVCTKKSQFFVIVSGMIAILSVFHVCETFLPGPCSHRLFNRARAGGIPWFIWNGILCQNIPESYIPASCCLLESLEMFSSRATYELMLNNLYTNQTKNGTDEFVDWEPMPRPESESLQVYEDGQQWGEIITYIKIGCTLILVLLIFNHNYQLFATNHPPVDYDGIAEALQPLHLCEKLILLFSVLLTEGVEFSFDTGIDKFFKNGDELQLKVPRDADYDHRISYISAIGYSFLVMNVVICVLPERVTHYFTLTMMGITALFILLLVSNILPSEYYLTYVQIFNASVGIASVSSSAYITSFLTREETWKIFLCMHELATCSFYVMISLNDMGLNVMYVGGLTTCASLVLVFIVLFIEIYEMCTNSSGIGTMTHHRRTSSARISNRESIYRPESWNVSESNGSGTNKDSRDATTIGMNK